jgi:bifunctional non-homologous end joining protein LigD
MVRSNALGTIENLPGVRVAPFPRSVDAQLATRAKEPPRGGDWLHEIKYDGYRILCHINAGRVKFVSRTQKDWTERFRSLIVPVRELKLNQAILDGEVVVFRSDGVSDFQTLQNAFEMGRHPSRAPKLVYCVFDLLYLNGCDLRGVSLEERKTVLESIMPAGQRGKIRYSGHVIGDGQEFFDHAKQLGLEGIVSKRRDSLYSGGRGSTWLKIKAVQTDEFVVGGFTPPGTEMRGGFGALLVGNYDKNGKLIFTGRVGTGFSNALLESLRKRLDRLEQGTSPFINLRKATADIKDPHWVKPRLVAQVEYTEMTRDGQLRHPSFKGLREDKAATAVVVPR